MMLRRLLVIAVTFFALGLSGLLFNMQSNACSPLVCGFDHFRNSIVRECSPAVCGFPGERHTPDSFLP